MIRSFIKTFLICVSLNAASLSAACCGKVDVGAVFVNLDILESGKTTETLHMYGAKADATVLIWNGVCIKPNLIWASGEGELVSASIGLGHCTPIPWVDGLILTPSIGYTYSYVSFHTDFEQFGLEHLRERFHSDSCYLALDLCYTFCEKWSLLGSYQYSWSHTLTKIEDLGSDKSHCCGPNYSLGLEYSITKQWAVNLGAAYNTSLSKEKHGIRGKGIKLGVAYYF